MKMAIVLVVLLTGCLQATAINTAEVSVTCVDPEDPYLSFSEHVTGLFTAQPSGALSGPCKGAVPTPYAWVNGLDFSVSGGESFDYSSATASIHGGAWYRIDGGVGVGLAYFDYYICCLHPENPARARTNAGPFDSALGETSLAGPFAFRFGVPFLLTIDAFADCCYPEGFLYGSFHGLDRATTLNGAPLPNAELTPTLVPEPSFAPAALLLIGAIWVVRWCRP